VLTDYKSETLNLDDPSVYRDLSRPVGALNEDRFEIYQERFQTFDDPDISPFMSGAWDSNVEGRAMTGVLAEADLMASTCVARAVPLLFRYGSHYSSAGIALYYLLRLEPYTSLAVSLQGGHFDLADRLFDSVAGAWDLSLNNVGDVKGQHAREKAAHARQRRKWGWMGG